MLDITKEIKLNKESLKLYRRLRALLYLMAIFSVIYFSCLVLFPGKNYFFDFTNPGSNNNNLDVPHFSDGLAPKNGQITSNKALFFSNILPSFFSKVNLNLALKNKLSSADDVKITVRKSYQAFLLDEGDPIGFKDGTLIQNDGNYYILSDGKIRRFSDLKTAETLGFPKDAFAEAGPDELKYNQFGDPVTLSGGYPDNSLFLIGDNYYQLTGKQLKKFSSATAYSSQYDPNQAITKDENFLNAYSVSPDPIGYADGSLVSNGDSGYIISAGQIHPIDNAQTFLGKGFWWEDVLSAGEDEVSMYKKAKLYNIDTAHPDGTVFETSEDNQFYMVKDGKKHLLPGNEIAHSWLQKRHPVMVTKKSLDTFLTCDLKKHSYFTNSYACAIPLDGLSAMTGMDYEFKVNTKNDIQMNSVNIDYVKNIDQNNLKIALLNILTKIRINYGP